MSHLKRLLLLSFTFYCGAVFCQDANFDPGKKFTVDQLREDFNFVRTELERKHPNLYLYTSKKILDVFLDSLYKNITTPLTALEFYQHISVLNGKIKDGHTMFLPGEQVTNYYNQQAPFFPFFISVIKNKAYVRMNCSADSSIKEGAEIIAINRISMPDLLQQLISRQIRDGNNETYPAWILSNYFKEYYSFSYGHAKQFSIRYKNSNDEVVTTIDALTKNSINVYKKLRHAKKALATTEGHGIFLETDQN